MPATSSMPATMPSALGVCTCGRNRSASVEASVEASVAQNFRHACGRDSTFSPLGPMYILYGRDKCEPVISCTSHPSGTPSGISVVFEFRGIVPAHNPVRCTQTGATRPILAGFSPNFGVFHLHKETRARMRAFRCRRAALHQNLVKNAQGVDEQRHFYCGTHAAGI